MILPSDESCLAHEVVRSDRGLNREFMFLVKHYSLILDGYIKVCIVVEYYRFK